VDDDAQLDRALTLLGNARSQAQLFAVAGE
jgi:hypothetical protein